MPRLAALLLCLLFPPVLLAGELPPAHLSAFGAGAGPAHVDGVYRLLDAERTPRQSNAVAFDRQREGAFERMELRCRFRVLEGGEGGAFVFLNTSEYGERGPAPFVREWTEPNLAGSFAVGIDVHDPPTDEPTGPGGNIDGMPEREVSLHWDGREIVKRVAPAEFRGKFSDCEIAVSYVTGGAQVTVKLAGKAVYDRYFVPGMLPYEWRLAVGAGTGVEATTEFDLRDLAISGEEPARERRPPMHVELFNHALTAGATSSFRRTVALPPAGWAFGRVILTLEIHDAGEAWDPWDRTGHLYVVDPQGEKRDIAPFITSFRTPCRWQVDVTRFRSWLAGKTTFEIGVETEREKGHGFMLSASLDFHHGTPELEPFRVVPLWHGTARYGSDKAPFGTFFAPRSVEIAASAKAARLFIAASGHSPVGEFTPLRRTIVFVPGKGSAERRFEDVLWKTDGYLNPNRPQFGTWKYARAGWAPGEVVRPLRIDLTPYMVPGATAELRYQPHPYDFTGLPAERRPSRQEIARASQLVRAYLVLYREPEGPVPAPHLRVLEVIMGSNAAEGEIREGDWVADYDGRRPGSIEALRELIREAETAGKRRIAVTVWRGDRQVKTELGPGKMGVLLEER